MARELFPVQRILFALDSATLSPGTINRVVQLAHRLGAALEVVFVEDEQLLQLADHPLIAHVSMPGGRQTRLERGRLERDFRVAGERTRVVLQSVTRRTNVQWSFRVARSVVPQEAAAAAGSCDLLVVGAGTNPLGGALQRTPAFAQLLHSCSRSALLLRPGFLFGGPALVLHDHGAGTARAVGAAASFMEPGDTIIILEPMNRPLDSESYRELAAELRSRRVTLQRRVTGDSLLAAAVRVQKAVGATSVVLPDELLDRWPVEELVDAVSSQVLVVRGSRS